jgi:3-oxoacyl-[acyl-carrier protein] reductase
MNEHPRDLQHQVALVTGSAQGLGLAIAHTLATRGAKVILGDVQQELAAESAAQWQAEGLKAEALSLDIGDTASVDRCFEQILVKHGRLDILVNNAGVGQKVAPIAELPDDQWERVLNVTLTGTFRCCRAAARIMQQQESGAIVNISSINGHSPAALVASYNAAKAAVLSLSKTLSLELAAYGVRVNVVSPGPVLTEFNRTVMNQRSTSLGITEDQMIERVRASIPLGRWGDAQDIANGVAFLCSPQASWITGETLRITGGLEGVSAVPPKRPK